jgi:hypothetical protein
MNKNKKPGKVMVKSRHLIIDGKEVIYKPEELANDIYEFLNHIEFEINELTPECIKNELKKKGIILNYPIGSTLDYCKEKKLIDSRKRNNDEQVAINEKGIKELKELRKRIIAERQSKIISTQTNILKNTLWIYFFMGVVLFSQLVISFIDFNFANGEWPMRLGFLFVFLAFTFFLLSNNQMRLNLEKGSWIYILNIALIIFLIIFLIVVMLNFNLFSLKGDEINNINTTNIINNSNQINLCFDNLINNSNNLNPNNCDYIGNKVFRK